MFDSVISEFLAPRLNAAAADFLRKSRDEIGQGVSNSRFAGLISLASRYAGRQALALSAQELTAAEQALAGWNPQYWNQLEALRIALILARRDLASPAFANALEDCFRYADEGELCALYRSLALLPEGRRFCWRAGEGCRTNMRSVFEAVACDTAYPVTYFDDTAWNQLVIKAIFIGAPLWRVHGLDTRLSPELTRMALDLADERRSAGRTVQRQLWLCLGRYGGQRAVDALEKELSGVDPQSRCVAALALSRAGHVERLQELLQTETDPAVLAIIDLALSGPSDQHAFKQFDV